MAIVDRKRRKFEMPAGHCPGCGADEGFLPGFAHGTVECRECGTVLPAQQQQADDEQDDDKPTKQASQR